MAPTKGKAVITVTPPAISRGGRKSQVPAEVISLMAETIKGGDYAGVPASTDSGLVEFVSESGSDSARKKAKGAANSAAVRHKKAIVNSSDNDIDDPATLRTRVWEARENVFVWAVGPKPVASDDDAE